LNSTATYNSTFKVIGAFLSQIGEGVSTMEAAQAFKDVLKENETPAQYRDTVVTAVIEKVMDGCKMGMGMDEKRRKSSRMTHDQMEEFLNKQHTGIVATDFRGISENTAAKLAENAGVETS